MVRVVALTDWVPVLVLVPGEPQTVVFVAVQVFQDEDHRL
jgi:hypothetical protein